MVKEGSHWAADNNKIFHVVSRIELEGNIWIHYRLNNPKENETAEFSCYEESFLHRFRQIVK